MEVADVTGLGTGQLGRGRRYRQNRGRLGAPAESTRHTDIHILHEGQRHKIFDPFFYQWAETV